jgi:acyl carrier protein
MNLDSQMNNLLRRVCNIPNNIQIDDLMSSDTVETWDSLANLNLIMELEEKYKIEIDFSELLDIENWGELKELAKKKINNNKK